MSLFSIMFSSDAMFETFSVYCQCINEQAAHVKQTVIPVGVSLGPSNSLVSYFSYCRMVFNYWGFMNENEKALGV